MGHLSLYLTAAGASRVLATDYFSERMPAVAKGERAHERVEYRLCAMEDMELPREGFDLVASSLSVHYVADHAALVGKVARWLRRPTCRAVTASCFIGPLGSSKVMKTSIAAFSPQRAHWSRMSLIPTLPTFTWTSTRLGVEPPSKKLMARLFLGRRPSCQSCPRLVCP
jgi:ubiquinone/menaquinone biosynthesis C-methylase UbiE